MKATGFKHIANRLLAWILGLCLLIFCGFALLLYQQTSRVIEQQAQARAQMVVGNTIQGIESLLGHVRRSVRTARIGLAAAQPDPALLVDLLHSLVQDKPEIYGMALALEQDILPGRADFAPYVMRSEGGLRERDLASGDYDYRSRPWYRNTVDQARSQWSEPYFDRGGGNTPMVTYSSPISQTLPDGSSRVLGVITADVSLETLSTMVDKSQAGFAGYAYILSAGGHVITHHKPELRLGEVKHLPAWLEGDRGWRKLLNAMAEGRSGQAILPCDYGGAQERCRLSYQALDNTDWSIVVAIPLAELEREQYMLRRGMLVLAGATIVLLGLLVLWLSRRLSRPINELARHTGIIASGDLAQPVPALQMQDEIGILANHIADMQRQLAQHILALTEATARRERMESELEIAASIQAQMLPDLGHSCFRAGDFQLAATLKAARQIGGDFYLYQMLEDQQLFFLVGDVSDKGIPAALFMAQCITEIRSLLTTVHSPAALFLALNHRLYPHNDNCMFVTAIGGLLDTRTGRCRLASAGHAPPLLMAETVTESALTPGPAMGLRQQVDYQELVIELAPGNTLLLYTDGVDEAVDGSGAQFGLSGLQQVLQAGTTGQGQTLVDQLLDTVLQFQQGQVFDDITILAIGRAANR